MKIGTVTFSDSKENYGQILQCYALIKFLRNIGHESFLIRIRHLDEDKRCFTKKILDKLKILFSNKLISIIKEISEQKRQHRNMERSILAHPRHFEEFIKKNIPSTPIWYNDTTILQNPPHAEAYICGSDQIWGGDLEYMYLTFAKNKLKISYAASFGGKLPDSDTLSLIKESIRSFKWISLREASGVEICKKMGYKNVEIVPDPTLLLTKKDYQRLYKATSRKTNEKPYIFLYLLGNQISIPINKIMNYARSQGLEVKYVTAHGRNDKFAKIYPTIEEWLQLIENAHSVITNSYHGTIFSIIYHKKFITLPITGVRSRMNTRLYELFSRYNLSNRVYSNSFRPIFDEIDYSTFDKVNKIEREYIYNKFNSLLQ